MVTGGAGENRVILKVLKHLMALTTGALMALLALTPAVGYTCDVVTIGHRKVNVAAEVVRKAAVIVRATASGYVVPAGNRIGPIRFVVVEVVRGRAVPAELTLQGELVAQDDFNVDRSPYDIVRGNGLAGSCFAWQYRTGQQYLLMLKKKAGELTPDWYPLAPVNEQLHSPEDPWLLWVRARANRKEKSKGLPQKQ
jgi:hypothetical protein